jgi:hypothetical protein
VEQRIQHFPHTEGVSNTTFYIHETELHVEDMWVDNIKMDLREIGWDGGDWIDLAQDRDQWRALVNAVMNLRVS